MVALGSLLWSVKAVVYRTNTWALSTGVGFNIPIGPVPPGQPHVKRYQPFLGFLYEPNNDWFYQAFLSYDIPSHNDASATLFLDLAMGYWVYRDPNARFLTGFAAFTELHFNLPTRDPSGVFRQTATIVLAESSGTTINVDIPNDNVVNMTLGSTWRIAEVLDIQTGLAFPIAGNRQFTLEGLLQAHLHY